MSGFLWHALYVVVIYALGVATAKNFKRFLLKLRADPRGTIDAEIASLRALKDRLPSR